MAQETYSRQNTEGAADISAKAGLLITCDMDEVLNYAIIHNGGNILRDVCIKNETDAELENLVVCAWSREGIIEKETLTTLGLMPGEGRHLKNPKLKFNAAYFASLTERISCSITIGVYREENQIAAMSANLTALAFDEWPGLKYTPEMLAAFSMPNHPAVASLMQLAAKYLDNWTKDPSLAGYQYNDPVRVNTMAAAAYAAIQQKNITYAEPPSSFEKIGQRIRLPDTMLEQHFGTCLDMTLLYAACLEGMGLHPLLVKVRGHIFAGVWLIKQSFSDTITDDPSQLEKRMSRGIREITVVECTAMCAGKNLSFDEAAAAARREVADYEKFEFVIDVKRARSMGIRPLPVRVKTAAGFEVRHEDRKDGDVTGASAQAVEIFDLPENGKKEKASKLVQWERKLLDLSLRNMLINMRVTRSVIPLLSTDVGLLEDALFSGEEFQVLPRPQEIKVEGDGVGVAVVTPEQLGPFAEFIKMEGSRGRLHALYEQKELARALTVLYRSAKTSLEENGASTLYLALGLLRWYEKGKEQTAHYAPVVLVPIDIIRKGGGKGYAMRMRDEDAQINITLCEFLKQNFGLRISGLNPPPADEHGLDIPRIFAIVRHAVMNLTGWDVLEAGFIGNFSFSQFVMWNDIHGSSDFLKNNKIVRSLMSGSLEWDCHIPEDIDTQEAYLPINVDSSQLRAINMAAAGTSFVLHGPPGTGKSQTITAMIANALTRGKTVLFVAEKMAALEVVQKRLEALGIGDFCLELHSNKATKKAVLDQLSHSLEIGVWGFQTAYDEKIQDVQTLRAELDAYAHALHVKRPFGKSLRELIDLYETIPQTGKVLRFDRKYAASLTERDLDHCVHSLERLTAAGRGVGHPHNHPLRAVRQTQYSQRIRYEAESVLETYAQTLGNLQNKGTAFAGFLQADCPDTESEWKDLRFAARSVAAAKEVPEFLQGCADINREFAPAETYLFNLQKFQDKRRQFRQYWNENFLHMDMNVYRSRYEAAGKKVFGKAKAYAALASEIQAYAAFPIRTDNIPAYLTDIDFYQKDEARIRDAWDALSYDWKQILEKYPTPAKLREYKALVREQVRGLSGISARVHSLVREGKLDACIAAAGELESAFAAVGSAQAEARELLGLRLEDRTGNWIADRTAVCTDVLANVSSLKDWIIYQQYAAKCREMGLGIVCDAYEEGLPHDAVMPVYLRSIYRAIILSVIENESVLNSFTGIGFNEKIAQFKKLDQNFMELTKEEMYYKLTHNLPTSYESAEISRELNILRRAIKSNGRGMSIRSLFEQIPHILPRLCPCMLMSPISAAQYLEPKNDLFDIVIFDEASQLPTCKAVGVLARGKNAVIAGDPNQMPPTSFFAGNTVDEDNLDIEDLDSILDDCLALGMPSSYLRWHYRSRHESLIAFSNEEFYENSMLTFPSVNDREKKVSMRKVEGFFDRGKGRVNEGEAKAIVAEIRRRYKDPEKKAQSVGVVTFNISQQSLIEDLLQAEYEKDLQFDRWANTGAEPLFVKNLENVQGDERDVILFSIAFGPDAEGKLLLNFGPINKEGGWKRLNVAVSRARMEMMVFTTMTGDRIDLRRTKSKGVEAMRDFLEYAEKGSLNGAREAVGSRKKEGIAEAICEHLDALGYTYRRAVGHSRFKVDIAVTNPYNEEEFLLGIMLDGESYRQSGNTKDRELSQISVLNGLGWEIHRIWTLDWWDNRTRELDKLTRLLGKKKEEACRVAKEKEEEACRIAKEKEEEACRLAKEKEKAAAAEDAASSEQEIAAAGAPSVQMPDEKTVFPGLEAAAAAGAPSAQKPAGGSAETEFAEGLPWPKEATEKPADSAERAASPGQNAAASAPLAQKPAGRAAASGNVGETVKAAAAQAPAGQDESAGSAVESTDTPLAAATLNYHMEEYTFAQTAVTPLSGPEYAKKENTPLIAACMQQILDAEAPIVYDRLVKKTLRAFGIGRSSAQTLEATDHAFALISAAGGAQNGTKVYWRTDQKPEKYEIYRINTASSDKRNADEICREEAKNAICITLKNAGALGKEDLVKETIRTMGYARSGKALVLAVERGLKYGCETGEIVQDETWRFQTAFGDR